MTKLDLDEKLVRKLSKLLEETGLTEIEYESEGRRIRVVRQLQAALVPPAPAPLPAGDPKADAAAAAPGEANAPANAISAPMVGTAYVAPEPGIPAFVNVGDHVDQGTTLLLIEAMKVMNPIPSPRAGTVTQIFISDGQPVEFGEPLMVVE